MSLAHNKKLRRRCGDSKHTPDWQICRRLIRHILPEIGTYKNTFAIGTNA